MAEISAAAVKALRDKTGAGMMDCKRVLTDADGDIDKAVELLRERGLAKAGKREGRATSEGVIAISLVGSAGGMVEIGCETDFVARTDDFSALATSLAEAIAGDAAIDAPDALLEQEIGGEKVADRVSAAIAKLGENVVVKRVARLAVDGGHVGGYVHAGGKLGVLVGLDSAAGDAEALAKDLSMHVAAADPSPVAVSRDDVPAELLESERKIYRAQAEQEGKPEKVIERIVDGKLKKFLADVVLVEQAFVKDPDKAVKDLLGDVSVTGFERFKLGETGEA
ncbi:MAG: elongation factor Ts [Deltaproteobacteria bacterium]|nr:elongation factor Ts [Deltaproteobacteria bacterium]MBW2362421.1 elongation factor Ts [Deltaproteobacteria bacterium]